MFVDEPFNALDQAARVHLRDELRHVWQRDRRTILLVTHDVGEAEALASRILVLTEPPGR